MSLDLQDFDVWFAEFHSGNPPFAWQRELLEQLLTTGNWPSAIVAPTGAGKSSVIHVHAFAVAATAESTDVRPPRRLAHVVGRRALVDDMALKAQELNARLELALERDESSVIGDVARTLNALGSGSTPVPITVLRGGVPPHRGWVDEPTACQIVCATPDMLGSRLLFRGYGSSANARPREAGLLAYDTALVVDEAHLNRQLLLTARRIAALAQESPLSAQVPVLQVIETTATPSETVSRDSIGVDLAQPLDDEHLTARMTRPKAIERHPGLWLPGLTKAPERKAAVTAIIDVALGALQEDPAGPVGIVVNRVDSAVTLFSALRSHPAVDARRAALLIGPQRAWEREMERRRAEPPLFYVATQTIEVGVDLDLCALVTDLAPGTALAQRAGRLNRRGLRPGGVMHLLEPAAPAQLTEKAAMPYAQGDLRLAAEWIEVLAGSPAGISPQAVQADPAPHAAPGRLVFSHLEDARAALLARTSERQVVEPELGFWLRDQLEETPEVSVLGRRLPFRTGTSGPAMGRPIDRGEAVAMMTAAPPQPHEIFPSTLVRVRNVLESCVWRSRHDERMVLVRRAGEWMWLDLHDGDRLGAGDMVCLPDDVQAAYRGALLADAAVVEPIGDVLDPRGSEGERLPLPAASSGRRLSTFVARPDALSGGASGRAILEATVLRAAGELLDSGQELTLHSLEDALIDRGRAQALEQWLRAEDEQEGHVHTSIAFGAPSELDPRSLSWMVITQVLEPADNAALISELSSEDKPVLLKDHQQAVGQRAEQLGRAVGLEDGLISILGLAGLHHDDGKADPRFQRRLLADSCRSDGCLLAKSPMKQRWSVQWLSTELPPRWRHEQLSAAMLLAEDPDADDLIVRLVGTSHGHGRGVFRHGSRTLLSEAASPAVVEAANLLFDVGQWDALIDRTHRRWGLWGAAYLEALLRAADTTISREGR